jgi:putative inorganic carbon (hco3(-)) transporter
VKPNRWSLLLQNQVVAITLALTLVVPMLFAASLARRMDQWTVYGFLGLLLFVVWLLRSQDRITFAKLRDFALSGPNLPIFLYLGWGVLSVALSAEPFYSRLVIIQQAFGVLIYAMVVYQFRRKEQVKALLSSLLVLGVVVVIGAFVLDADRHLRDLAGSFHDRQLLGAFLALMLPVLMGVAAGTQHRVWKIGAQLTSVLVAGALLLTGCRSAWMGVIVAVCVFIALSLMFAWKWNSMTGKKHELLVTPVLALAALGIFVMFTRTGNPLQGRASTLSALHQDASVSDRVNLWNAALRVIEARPLTGWGIGSYPLVQTQFNPDARSPETILRKGPSLWESPHNTYLHIGAEQGLIGLGLYLAILGMFFYCGLRALPKMDRGLRQYTLIGCLAALSGQVVDAVSNPGYMFPEVSMFFWLVLGIGMCAAGVGRPVREENLAKSADEPVLGMPRFLYRGLRTAVVGCLALIVTAQLLNLNQMAAASAGSVRASNQKDEKKPPEPEYPDDDDDDDVPVDEDEEPDDDDDDDDEEPKPPHRRDDDDDDTAWIVAGSLVGAGLAYGAIRAATTDGAGGVGGNGGEFAMGAAHECPEKYPPLPADVNRISEIRLVPEETSIRAGYCRCFSLEVKSEQDGKWYSVTHRNESRIALRSPSEYLMKRDGTKNIFCVPADTSADANGMLVVLVGTLTLEGQAPYTAEATVKIRVPGRSSSSGTNKKLARSGR